MKKILRGGNMSKVMWKPGTFLYPIPAVMVSCGTMEKSNIITVAWTGILNTNPAMVYISVRPSRYSYNLIKEQGEFVINLTTKQLAKATDWCGVKSNTLCMALSSKTHQSGSHPVTGQKLHWRRYPPEVEKEGSGI